MSDKTKKGKEIVVMRAPDAIGLTKKHLKWLFYAIEVNLLLWIMVVGAVWSSSAELTVKQITIVGFIVAGLLQHWTYHKLYKKAAETKLSNT